jgi:hypothetical protein
VELIKPLKFSQNNVLHQKSKHHICLLSELVNFSVFLGTCWPALCFRFGLRKRSFMKFENVISILLSICLFIEPAILMAADGSSKSGRSLSVVVAAQQQAVEQLGLSPAITAQETENPAVTQLILKAEQPGVAPLTFSLVHDGQHFIGIRVNDQKIINVRDDVEAIDAKLQANPELKTKLLESPTEEVQTEVFKLIDPEINSILGKIFDALPPQNPGLPPTPIKPPQEAMDFQVALNKEGGTPLPNQEGSQTGDNGGTQTAKPASVKNEKVSKLLIARLLVRKAQAKAYMATYGLVNLAAMLTITLNTVALFGGIWISDNLLANGHALLFHTVHSLTVFGIKLLARAFYKKQIAVIRNKIEILEDKIDVKPVLNVAKTKDQKPKESTQATSLLGKCQGLLKFIAL